MEIEELLKVLACNRETALKKVDIFVSYFLFRARLLAGSDTIPGVGELSITEDNNILIKLDQKWVDLLEGKSCDEILLTYIMDIVNAKDI